MRLFNRSPDLAAAPLDALERELALRGFATVPIAQKATADRLAAGQLKETDVSEILAVIDLWKSVAEDALALVGEERKWNKEQRAEIDGLRIACAHVEQLLARELMADLT
jgi:hypothetical protein